MLYGPRALLLVVVLLAGNAPLALSQEDDAKLNDKAVRISFEFAVYEVWEDQGPVKLRLKANKPLDMKGQQDVFIKPLEIVPVSAQDRVDFSDDTKKVTFEAGAMLSSFATIDIIDDRIMEENKTFICVILKSTRSEKDDLLTEDPNVATIAILDNDFVSVHFEKSEYFGREVADSESTVEYAVVVDGEFEVNFTVAVETEDGTARGGPGLDYANETTEFVFLPNLARLVGTTTIYDDKMLEGDETYNLTLSIVQSIGSVVVSEPREALVHIEDNDEVMVAFEKDFYSATEGDSVVEVTIIATGALIASSFSVRVFTSDSNPPSATGDEDYSTTDVLVHFAVGQTPMTRKVAIPILEDSILELAEQLVVSLEVTNQTTRGVKLGTLPTTTVQIADNDAIVVSFVEGSVTVEENVGVVSLQLVAIGAEIGTPFTVQVDSRESVPPSARGDIDFVTTTINVTFTPGNPLVAVNIVILDDTVLEIDEVFVTHLIVTNDTLDGRVTAGNITDVVVTILDDEEVTVQFAVEARDVFEYEGVIVVPVVLTGGTLDLPITVRVEVMEKTAEEVLDFTVSTGEFVIQPNTTQYDLEVEIINDIIREGTEEFEVTFTISSTIQVVTRVTTGIRAARIAIIDDDSVSVEFTESMMTVVEEERTLTVCLTKRGATTLDAEVTVTTCDRTVEELQSARRNGSPGPFSGDYVSLQLAVLFSPLKAESCVEVAITDDMVVEELEVFGLCLEELDPTVMVGTVNTTTVTIIDDDSIVVGFLERERVVMEIAGVVDIVVVKRGRQSIPLEVRVVLCNGTSSSSSRPHRPATESVDFIAEPATLTFDRGVTRQTYRLFVLTDNLNEATESFDLCLDVVDDSNTIVGMHNVTTVIITDDDDIVVDFISNSTVVPEEGGVFEVVITITGGVSEVPVTLTVTTTSKTATNGSDFEEVTSEVTIPPGVTSVTVPIAITDDIVVEGTEDFLVTFTIIDSTEDGVVTTSTGTNTSTTVVIIEDNDRVVVEFERTLLTAQEDVLTLSVCLVKTGESTINNSIDVFACNKSLPGHVSATDKVDYSSASLMQSITFAPAENRQCFNADIIDDMVVENNETFAACVRTDSDFVEIGPNNSTTVVIVDNDVVTVQFEKTLYPAFELNQTYEVCVVKTGGVTSGSISALVSVCDNLDRNDPVMLGSGVDEAAGSGIYADYRELTLSVTLLPTQSRVCVFGSVTDDMVVENVEAFDICLTANTERVVVGPIDRSSVIIEDNDVVVVSFLEPVINATEDQNTVDLCVLKVGRHSFDIEVHLEVCDTQSLPAGMTGLRQASRGFDFEFSPNSFVFESKITQLCTPVSILDDFLEEEREYVSFCLRIINPMRTVLGLYNSSTIVIEDNDRIDVELGTTVTVQNVTTVTVTVTLTNDSITTTVNVTIDRVTIPGFEYEETVPKVFTVVPPSTMVNLSFSVPTELLPINATVSVKFDIDNTTTIKNVTVTIPGPQTAATMTASEGPGPSASVQPTDTFPSESVQLTEGSNPSASVQPTVPSESIQTTERAGPTVSVQPTEGPVPSETVQPTDAVPTESVNLTEDPGPSESAHVQPTGTAPSESVQPTEDPGPAETVQPTDTLPTESDQSIVGQSPSDSIQTTNSVPLESIQPTEGPGPSESVQSTDTVPTRSIQPTEGSGPPESIQHTDSASSESMQPTESPDPGLSKSVQPTDTAPTRSVQPTEGPGPSESISSTVATTSESVQPTEGLGPSETAQPTDAVPTESVSLTTGPGTSESADVQPTGTAPSESVQPTEDPGPAETVQPTDTVPTESDQSIVGRSPSDSVQTTNSVPLESIQPTEGPGQSESDQPTNTVPTESVQPTEGPGPSESIKPIIATPSESVQPTEDLSASKSVQPTDTMPLESVQQTEGLGPSESVQPTNTAPSESMQPTEGPVPSESISPTVTTPSESVQPTEGPVPSESISPTVATPSESVQPTEGPVPSESDQPTDTVPTETVKLSEGPGSSESIKPIVATPSESVQPTEGPVPSKSVQPTDTVPTESVNLTEDPGPSESAHVQPTGTAPSESVQPTEDPGPAETVQPTDTVPTESDQSIVSSSPSDSVQTTNSVPSESIQPTEGPGPAETVQSTDAVPTKSVQPTEGPGPSESIKPTVTTPSESMQPTESVQSTDAVPTESVQPSESPGPSESILPTDTPSSDSMQPTKAPDPSESGQPTDTVATESVQSTSVAPLFPMPTRTIPPIPSSSTSGPPPLPTSHVTVVFEHPLYIVVEGDDVEVCLSRQGTLSNPLTVTVLTCFGAGSAAMESGCGDAEENDDYKLTRTKVTFDPEQDESCLTIEAVSDTITEGTETFVLCLEEFTVSTTVVIQDNNAILMEFVRSEAVEVHESQATFNVCVVKHGENSCPVTALVTTCSGSSDPAATGGVDYRPIEFVVTFESHEIVQCFNDITVLDDMEIEPNESFGICLSSNTSSVTIPEDSTVTAIIKNDDVRVEFTKDRYIADTENETAVVCLKKTEGDVDFNVTVEARPKEITSEDFFLGEGEEVAKADIHFSSKPFTVTFAPGEVEKCVGIDILLNADSDTDLVFVVSLSPKRPANVMNASVFVGDDTTVVITEATFTGTIDDKQLIASCTVENPLIITPFRPISPATVNVSSYSFMGPCEYELVRICDGFTPFRIHVDFLSQDLNTGRVGIVLGEEGADEASLGLIILYENLTVGYERLEDPVVAVTGDGTQSSFNRSRLVVLQSTNAVKVHVLAFGISVQLVKEPDSESLVVNVTVSEDLLKLCGLCGDIAGQLVFRDTELAADVASPEQVKTFIQSWRVLPDMQFLRDQREECGIIRNDTVIGDPLFTAPLLVGDDTPELQGLSLCFEIHGISNRHFNFISDTCTSVNALYSPMIDPSHGNIVSKVGIAAVDSNGRCVDVAVDLDGCAASLNGEAVQMMRSEAGVTIFRRRDRVRIGVPNCENLDLIMWVICQNISGQPMIKFVVSRGYNLRPMSHGLLGQFWNIPVSVSSYEPPSSLTPEQSQAIMRTRPYVVTVAYPGANTRSFTAYLYHRTWDKTASPCLYGGNSQGGPWSELPGPNDPLIEGTYKDYLTRDLFDVNYKFSKFEGVCSR